MRFVVVALGLVALATPALAEEQLTVDDAVRIARKNHPNIGVAKAQLTAQHERVHEALSGFTPSATGQFAYIPQTANFTSTPGFIRELAQPTPVHTLADGTVVQCAIGSPNCGPGAQPMALPADYSLFNYWSAGLGLYWTLFDWGRTFYNYRSQKSTERAQVFTVAETAAQVVLDVKVAFFNAIATDRAVQVAIDAVKTQQQHLDQARAFYQVGQRTRIDVAQSEADLATAELTLARARGNDEAARAQLGAALGLGEWHPWQLIEPPLSLPALDSLDRLVDEAMRNRVEPLELGLRARSYEELKKSVRGNFLPSLVLNAGPTFSGIDIANLTTNFSISIALSYPLTGVSPYLVAATMHEADANRLATLEQRRNTINQIKLETANAHAQMVSAREELISSEKLLTAARERRDLAEGRYRTGVGSIIELSDAQLQFINAEYQDVQARLDLATAQARLDHALGRLY